MINWSYGYQSAPIERLFTYHSFEDDYILHRDGSVTVGMRFQPIGITATPNDAITATVDRMRTAIPEYEDGSISTNLQYQFMFSRDNYLPRLRKEYENLRQEVEETSPKPERARDTINIHEEHFVNQAQNHRLFEDNYYLFITYDMSSESGYLTRLMDIIKNSGKVVTGSAAQSIRNEAQKKMSILQAARQNIASTINSAENFGEVEILDAGDMFKKIQRFINPVSTMPRRYEGNYQADGDGDRLSRSVKDFNPDSKGAHIEVGGEEWSFFRLAEKPNRYPVGIANKLTTLRVPFRMIVSFKLMTTDEAVKLAEDKKKSASLLANHEIHEDGSLGEKQWWFLEENREAIEAFRDATQYRHDALERKDTIIGAQYDMRFLLRIPSDDTGINTFKRKIREMQNADVYPVEKSGRKFEFLSTLPGMEKFPRDNTGNLSQVLNISPLMGAVVNEDARPIFVLPNNYGTYTKYDPFDRQGSQNSWHKLIIGTTGSGKSVLNSLKNYLSYLYEGARIYVVEAGNSAKGYVEGLGGEYITMGRRGAPTFNPLYGLYKPPDLDDENLAEQFELRQRNLNMQVISNLCFKGEPEKIQDYRPVIGEAVRSAIEAGREANEEPTYSVVYELLENHLGEKGQAVAERFSEYVGDGLYADIIDGQNEIPLDENPLGFNVEEILQDRLIRDEVFTLIIQLINSNLPQFRSDIAFVDLDEYHAYAKNEDTKNEVSYSVRTYRKLGAACSVLTQGPGDFDDELGEALRQNAVEKIWMKVDESAKRELADWDMNEKKVSKIMDNHVEPGEYSLVFIDAPWGAEQGKVDVPGQLMQLFETDFREAT